MKKVLTLLAASAALAASSFAGSATVSSGKSYKESKTVQTPEPPTCFSDQELQIDTFGAYAVGAKSTHAGPIRDDAWGGGVGVSYFCHRYFGVGVDATWLYGEENAASPGATDDSKTFHNFTGSIIFRYPIDSLCLAPYLFAGGGFHVDGDQWASGHVGVGVEYRVVPHRIGLFADARWTYFGTRYDEQDQNNFLIRAGLRVVF